MLFFCLVAASGPSQEQFQLHPSRASPEREASIREAYVRASANVVKAREAYASAHELAAGVAKEQAAIDTMSVEMIDAEMARLLQRRDMLCNSAERTVQQNGTSTSSADLCNSTAFVPRALELSAQRQDGADAATSSDEGPGRRTYDHKGEELCPGHPNILLSSPTCPTASTSEAKQDEPCPGHPHILRSSPTCLEKAAADPSDARLTGSKTSVSPKAQDDEPKEKGHKGAHKEQQQQQQQQQQQVHGIGQQGSPEQQAQQGAQGGQEGQSAEEHEQMKMKDMEAPFCNSTPTPNP